MASKKSKVESYSTRFSFYILAAQCIIYIRDNDCFHIYHLYTQTAHTLKIISPLYRTLNSLLLPHHIDLAFHSAYDTGSAFET